MGAKPSSSLAYRQAVIDGTIHTYRDRILEILEVNAVPLSRRQINAMTRGGRFGPEIPINAIPRATAGLIQLGRIHVAYVDTDPKTGRRVEFLALGKGPGQARLLP